MPVARCRILVQQKSFVRPALSILCEELVLRNCQRIFPTVLGLQCQIFSGTASGGSGNCPFKLTLHLIFNHPQALQAGVVREPHITPIPGTASPKPRPHNGSSSQKRFTGRFENIVAWNSKSGNNSRCQITLAVVVLACFAVPAHMSQNTKCQIPATKTKLLKLNRGSGIPTA